MFVLSNLLELKFENEQKEEPWHSFHPISCYVYGMNSETLFDLSWQTLDRSY